MWDFLSNVVEFIVVGVILKIIVAHWIAERIQKYAISLFSRTERRSAIWNHYRSRAFGRGHESSDILECHEHTCSLFKTSPGFRVARAGSTSL
jgi:hypothetical protein